MTENKIIDATYYEKMLWPRIASYLFDEKGLARCAFVDSYHAFQMGLRPDFSTKEEAMAAFGDFVANNVGSRLNVRDWSSSERYEIDASEIRKFLESRLGNSGVVMPVPGSENIPGHPRMGLFIERREIPRWVTNGNLLRNVPATEEMVTVVGDTTWDVSDSTSDELGFLKSNDYGSKKKDIVGTLLSNIETRRGLKKVKAVIHDLRGTLRYNGLHLMYADYQGMHALLDAIDTPQIKYVATVTSGTKSEGTNFLAWANVLGHRYTHYKTFAIADSLTSAIDVLTPGYEQIQLVRDGAIDDITRSIGELAASGDLQCAAFVDAYNKWRNPDTNNSIIIDIPPGLCSEDEAEILSGAQRLETYHRERRNENISVINKVATSKGVRSVRLYVRPGFLESGVPIGKGPALAEYFSRNGISDPMHTIIYFADNFSTQEEITLGRYSSVGFEIKQGSEPVVEFGKYGVPAIVTAPTYLIAADIATALLDRIMPKKQLKIY